MKDTYALMALRPMKNPKAFSGKRVRANSVKLQNIKNREWRLRKIGLTLLFFAS